MGVFSTGLEEDGKTYDLRIEVKVDSNPANNLVYVGNRLSNTISVFYDFPALAEIRRTYR